MDYTVQSKAVGEKRKRRSAEYGLAEEMAWTAARCNRLLRTITSRIEVLRKCSPTDAKQTQQTQQAKARAIAQRKQQHCASTDPVWLPHALQKSRARTYTTKKASSERALKEVEAEAGRRGRQRQLTLPTPFVRRMKQMDSAPVCHSSPPARPVLAPIRKSRQLPIKPASLMLEAELGLQTALKNLLTVTTPHATPASLHRGARSLLDVCIRKVPDYIDLENSLNTDDAVDSSSEILVWLENLGSVEGGGWDGLRGIVRSQALNCISQAVHSHIVTDRCIATLVDSCHAHAALLEAEQIMQAWFQRSAQLMHQHLSSLSRLCDKDKLDSIRFRALHAFSHQNISRVAEVARTPGMWNELLGALTRDGSHTVAGFLQSCVEAHGEKNNETCLVTSQRKLLTTNLDQVSAKLSTMAITGCLLNEMACENILLREAVYHIGIPSLRRLMSSSSSSISSESGLIGGSWVFGALLVSALSGSDEASLWLCEALCSRSPNASSLSTIRKCMGEFITRIAEDIVALDTHAHLGLVDRLLERILYHPQKSSNSRNSSRPTLAKHLLRHFALEVVTIHRQATDTEDAYAAPLEAIMSGDDCGHENVPRTPHQCKKMPAFRWDDGLCEWVAKTPFVKGMVMHQPPAPTTPFASAVVAVAVKEGRDGGTDSSEEKENYCPHDLDDYPPTSSVWHSPDDPAVLSAPKRREKKLSSSLLVRKQRKSPEYLHPKVILPRNGTKRRKPNTLVHRQEDESCDELGL